MLSHNFFQRVLALLALGSTLAASDPVPDRVKHVLINPSTVLQGGAQLGFSVAIGGDLIVAGAPTDRYAEGFVGGGTVKIFHATTGALLFVLLSPNKYDTGDFGRTVAISGRRVAVGSPRENNTTGATCGAVYVYDLDSVQPTVPILRLLKPVPEDDGYFGHSIAISGTRIAVGENRRNSEDAAAFVYDVGSATPTVPVATINMTAFIPSGYISKERRRPYQR